MRAPKLAVVGRRIRPGSPYPLGATWDGRGVNFALFSANATNVELCLFNRDGSREIERILLPEYTDEIWHGYVADLEPGTLYGYRVFGPYDPHSGHRFNPHKLVLDPYARSFKGTLRWSDAHFAYRLGGARADLSFDRRDNARGMPKCEVVDAAFTWGSEQAPATPWDRTIIYEAHLRGLTMKHPEVPAALRGSAAGLAQPAVIQHLRSLGITAVELLPVHAFAHDRHLQQKGLANYWGYNSFGFFAPQPAYLASGSINEFKTMVARLHDAGIEVILDVVYNHTAEGNHLGPTLSFRGIDNASYYRLSPEQPRYYIDDTGVGNALNLAHPRVLQMVLDSLRYWAGEMRVDGFRFDLCSTLGREGRSFDPGSAFFDAVRQDPLLSQVKLIAEPWDIGPEGYQLGNYPPGWAEWNDRYRDTIRRFWRGDADVLPELGARLDGSADLFDRRGRRPWSSINFAASHDGFTLADIVSYAWKHNEANLEDNRDGHNENYSANYGTEGATDDPELHALRRRQRRNLLATLLFSQGTPMLLGGDELGRTQQGNNNAYAQDNAISWVSWRLDEAGQTFLAFVKRVIASRQAHPVLRRGKFLHGREVSRDGLKDILWLGPSGQELSASDWHNPESGCIGMLLNGAAGEHFGPDGETLADGVLLAVFNARVEDIEFVLPSLPSGGSWRQELNTDSEDGSPRDDEPREAGASITVAGRSVVLLAAPAGDSSA